MACEKSSFSGIIVLVVHETAKPSIALAWVCGLDTAKRLIEVKAKMTYSKLTPAVIEPLISHLQRATQSRGEVLMYQPSVRSLCAKVGISHTTFYRWLNASRAIPPRKRRLTASEQLLRAFGRAVEASLEVSEDGLLSDLKSILGSLAERTSPPPDTPPDRPAEHPDLQGFEARTDALVCGGGVVEFDVPRFSLKNK